MKATDFDRIEQAVKEVAPDAIFKRTSPSLTSRMSISIARGGDSLHITVYLDYPSPHFHAWAHGICGAEPKAVLEVIESPN